jgi:hypothetical protein
MFDYLADEKWNRTFTEMGLRGMARSLDDLRPHSLREIASELESYVTVVGVYRNHCVTVSESARAIPGEIPEICHDDFRYGRRFAEIDRTIQDSRRV